MSCELFLLQKTNIRQRDEEENELRRRENDSEEETTLSKKHMSEEYSVLTSNQASPMSINNFSQNSITNAVGPFNKYTTTQTSSSCHNYRKNPLLEFDLKADASPALFPLYLQ